MDVTGSRLDRIKMLVSKENQQKNSQCDKQMKVQRNENYQGPSWLNGNTKSSSWPIPKTEKDYSCADKENADPRQPCKNIFNKQNQVKKDGFDIEEVISPITQVEISPRVTSPKWNNDSGMLTDGSPMVMSSLFSGRIIFDASDDLNLLNDDIGASPMFNLPSNPFSVNTIDKSISKISSHEKHQTSFGSVLTQSGANCYNELGSKVRTNIHADKINDASMSVKRQYRSVGKRSCSINLTNSYPSPISRNNSVEHISGFKRPLIFPSPSAKNPNSENEIPHQNQKSSTSNDLGSEIYQGLSLNQSSAKRPKKDNEGQVLLHKSHSMSALYQMSKLDFGEIKQSVYKTCPGKPRKESFKQNSRLCRSKSFVDPIAEARVMDACTLAALDSNRTGDTKLKLLLPIIPGHSKNSDLKNIDCDTMAKLLNGEFTQNIARCRIIDARYCYEFEGGHIRGAENYGMWEEEAFLAEFFPPSLQEKILSPNSQKSTAADNKEHGIEDETGADKREILVFHCEFSSARGPALMRLLRKKDREINKATYPALHYPECYLLHDGYKAFYEAYPHLCVGSYLPMKHPQFASEERKFHKKSKSWAAGGGGTVSRTGASSRLLKL